jgi:hypothetical protein
VGISTRPAYTANLKAPRRAPEARGLGPSKLPSGIGSPVQESPPLPPPSPPRLDSEQRPGKQPFSACCAGWSKGSLAAQRRTHAWGLWLWAGPSTSPSRRISRAHGPPSPPAIPARPKPKSRFNLKARTPAGSNAPARRRRSVRGHGELGLVASVAVSLGVSAPCSPECSGAAGSNCGEVECVVGPGGLWLTADSENRMTAGPNWVRLCL